MVWRHRGSVCVLNSLHFTPTVLHASLDRLSDRTQIAGLWNPNSFQKSSCITHIRQKVHRNSPLWSQTCSRDRIWKQFLITHYRILWRLRRVGEGATHSLVRPRLISRVLTERTVDVNKRGAVIWSQGADFNCKYPTYGELKGWIHL